MEEMVVEGIILDAGAYVYADQLHSRAEKYLLKAADINKVMGSSASTDANPMRLMKSSGIKCRETAEKRVMEVVPQNIHQRSPMFVGSTSMVKDLQECLADRAPVYRNGPRDEL